MKLEELIAGYVDLAEQAVAYRKATESREEQQNKPWKVLASYSDEPELILAYIAVANRDATAVRIADVEVVLFGGTVTLPYEPEKREGLEDNLMSARKKMLEITLMQSLDSEGGEA